MTVYGSGYSTPAYTVMSDNSQLIHVHNPCRSEKEPEINYDRHCLSLPSILARDTAKEHA